MYVLSKTGVMKFWPVKLSPTNRQTTIRVVTVVYADRDNSIRVPAQGVESIHATICLLTRPAFYSKYLGCIDRLIRPVYQGDY